MRHEAGGQAAQCTRGLKSHILHAHSAWCRNGLVNYEVKVSGASAQLQVEAVFTEALKPFPEEVRSRPTPH